MSNRIALWLCMFIFMFLAACGGSKGSGTQADMAGGKGTVEQKAAPTVDEFKKFHDEAVSITEENHELAREIFDLKNKLNVE